MAEPYTFRELTDADAEAWDALAGAHPLGDFAQAWAWGHVKSRGEWTAVRTGLFAGDELVAGAQVLFRPLKLGRTLAYACRGPLVDLTSLDGATQRAALFDGLQRLCAQRNAIALKVDPCVGEAAAPFLRNCGAVQTGGLNPGFGGTQPRWVMRLDLTPGLDAVFAGFKPDYRNRIRKSERRGVTVRAATTLEDWRAWYALLLETAERQDFAVRGFDYYAAIREDLQGACQERLLLAEREGRLVGGILCIRFGHTVWYLYGGMNEEGREHYSGYTLQWAAMTWAVAEGCATYDFRGVAPPDQADDEHHGGLNRFKAGFGPELVEWVGEWDLVFQPLAHRAFEFLLPKARALLRRLRK